MTKEIVRISDFKIQPLFQRIIIITYFAHNVHLVSHPLAWGAHEHNDASLFYEHDPDVDCGIWSQLPSNQANN